MSLIFIFPILLMVAFSPQIIIGIWRMMLIRKLYFYIHNQYQNAWNNSGLSLPTYGGNYLNYEAELTEFLKVNSFLNDQSIIEMIQKIQKIGSYLHRLQKVMTILFIIISLTYLITTFNLFNLLIK